MNKKRPGKGISIMGIAGIAAAVFGVIWTIETNSMTRNSPFGGGPKMIMTAGGILFVVIAVLIAVRSFRSGAEEDQEPGDSSARGGTEQAAQGPGQPREKAKWTCPYCGTAVDEDEAFCPGCGAGRKKTAQ